MVILMINDMLNTNFYELWVVSERAIVSLISLFLVTKFIGKKQVSELNMFDYVISISIGNFAAEMTMNLDTQVLDGFVAVIIFGVIALLVSIGTMKSIVFRRFVMGNPTVIIQDGKFIYKNLKEVKMDINDFLETCRAAGYFDVSKIKYAVMEANGKVSFLPKEAFHPVVNEGLNIIPQKSGLCANVIIDGKIMKHNVLSINKTETWLKNEVKARGIDLKDVLLGTIDVNDKLVIFKKNKDLNDQNVLS